MVANKLCARVQDVIVRVVCVCAQLTCDAVGWARESVPRTFPAVQRSVDAELSAVHTLRVLCRYRLFVGREDTKNSAVDSVCNPCISQCSQICIVYVCRGVHSRAT